MKLLVAEDDPVYRELYVAVLGADFEVTVVGNGRAAWETLQRDPSIRLVILNWEMPEMSGLEVCQNVRLSTDLNGLYILVATSNDRIEQVLEGFIAGANDYVCKPFYVQELSARLRVGRRVIELQSELLNKVSELEKALGEVKLLQGLLSICSYCKRIRTEDKQWQELDMYVSSHSEAQFSHGICPTCRDRVLAEDKW